MNGIKVVKVETIRPLSHPSSLWIQLHDDQGNVGLGETFFSQSVIEEYVHKIAAPIILNTPLINPELMNFLLRPYVGFQGGGIEVRAIGGLDIALWDLWGKRRGATLSELLGGQVHADLDVYNTCAGNGYMSKTASQSPQNWGLENTEKLKYDDLNGFLQRPKELARDLFDSGITGMKIWPFDFAAERTRGTNISKSEIESGLKIVSDIREEVGMDMNLMIELHGLWNRPSAEIIMNSLEEFSPYWIEDPLRPDSVDAINILRSNTGMRIALGETSVGRREVLPLLQSGAIDYLTLDIQWTGGLTEARKMASLADTFAIPIAPHDCTGPVSLATSTHFSLSQPNGFLQETCRAFIYSWYEEFTEGIPKIKGGKISVNQEPGHGVTLKEWLFSSPDVIIRTSE